MILLCIEFTNCLAQRISMNWHLQPRFIRLDYFYVNSWLDGRCFRPILHSGNSIHLLQQLNVRNYGQTCVFRSCVRWPIFNKSPDSDHYSFEFNTQKSSWGELFEWSEWVKSSNSIPSFRWIIPFSIPNEYRENKKQRSLAVKHPEVFKRSIHIKLIHTNKHRLKDQLWNDEWNHVLVFWRCPGENQTFSYRLDKLSK
jgi:hypothetical protein